MNAHSERIGFVSIGSMQHHLSILTPVSPLRATERPRIALYADSDMIGGAERSLLNLAAAYRGDRELVICSPSAPLLEAAERIAPSVAREPIVVRTGLPGSLIDHRRAFRSLDIDLLQVTLCNPFAARPAMLAGFSLRVPTVAVEQLVLPSRRRRGRAMKRIASLPLAAHVAVGERTARDLTDFFGIAPTRTHVIHNGVSAGPVQPQRLSHRPSIGCAARLDDQKSLDILVAAVGALPDVHLVLVGDGSRRPDLEAQAALLGITDRVSFVGWQEDARPFIAAFDVFVLPSRDEAFPLSIAEAMLLDTAVVATDVGSVSEAVIDGHTGLLVPPGDTDALVAAIERVLSDDAFRASLVSNARKLAETKFTADVMALAYDELWTSLL